MGSGTRRRCDRQVSSRAHGARTVGTRCGVVPQVRRASGVSSWRWAAADVTWTATRPRSGARPLRPARTDPQPDYQDGSARTVNIDEATAAALRELRKRHAEKRLVMGGQPAQRRRPALGQGESQDLSSAVANYSWVEPAVEGSANTRTRHVLSAASASRLARS